MERFRQINIKDRGKKLFKTVFSAAKKFDQDVSWDLWESGKMRRLPLPGGIDLEAEKNKIVHLEECWVSSTRVMLRESFRLDAVAAGYSVVPTITRIMQLECQWCEGCGPNLLQEHHLQNVRKDLLAFGNIQREKAKQEWIRKQKGEIW